MTSDRLAAEVESTTVIVHTIEEVGIEVALLDRVGNDADSGERCEESKSGKLHDDSGKRLVCLSWCCLVLMWIVE